MTSPNHAAEELLKQKQQLEPLLEISPSATVITDRDSNVVAWNPAAEELFGYSAEEAVGRNLDDLVAKTEELHRAAVAYSERALEKDQIRTVTRRTRKDGTLVDVEVRAAPLVANGETIGTFGIYHDITELHRQRRFYEALVAVSPAAIVAIDPQDRVTMWNPAAESLFGYTAQEAIGRNVDDLVARDEAIREEAEQLNRTAEGGQIRMVGRRTRKDGSLVDVELLGAPVLIGDELVGRYAIYLDISELQRRKQYYEALVEVSPEAIVTTGPEDTVTSWNPAAERLFGYTAEEAVGMNIDDLVTRGGEQRTEGVNLSRATLEGPTAHRVTQRTRKDGSLVDVDIVGGPVIVGDELVGKHVFYHDVTELQRQRRYYESLVQLSPTAIVVTDLHSNVTAWNPAAEQLFRYTAEEAIGRNLDDLVANREDLHAEGVRFSEAAIRGERIRAFSRRTRRDGSLVDVEIISEPIVVGDETLGFLAIYHDVTELQHQKRYFEAVLQLSPTAIVTVGEEFRVTSWNPAAEELFGYTAEEAMGRLVDDLVANSAEIREEAAAMNEAGASGQEAKAIGRRTRKDGSFVDVQIVAGPVYVSGERVGHSVMYTDIGEIQRQKRYYQSVLELSPTAIVTVDEKVHVTSWNPAAEKLFGYTAEEAIGRFIDDLVADSPELREEAAAFNEAGLGEEKRAITRRMRKDGSLIDVEMVGTGRMPGEGVEDIVIYHDISEIQRQKRYYEAVLEVSPTAIVMLTHEGTITSWNPAAERLFGYSPEEAIGQDLDDLVARSDEIREEALRISREGRTTMRRTGAITRRTRKDGTLVDVEVAGVPVIVAGEHVGDCVVYHDISEIQLQKRYYESLLEMSPAAIMTVDLDATVTSWNPAAERLLGYSREEAIGRNIDDLVANRSEVRDEAESVSQRTAVGEQVHLVTRRTRKDGSLIDVDVVAAPIIVGGNQVAYYTMYSDIGEIQRQKRYYEALVEASPVAVVLVDVDGETVNSWNPAAERLFGYSAEEAIGRRIVDLVAWPEDLRNEANEYARQLQRTESIHAVTRRVRKDGSLVDVDLLGVPVMLGGEHVADYVLYHDISEIQRQRRYYEQLVDASPVAVVLVESDSFTITSWNPAAERLFGYAAEEAIGQDMRDLVNPPEEMRDEMTDYGERLKRREAIHAVTRRIRKDGSLVDVEMLAVPVMQGGERVGDYVLYHDIGELQQARREAEAATHAKSAFLATMSHEIRTPLNAVIGMTGLLLDTDLAPEQRSYGEVIRTSGDALLTVINEILDFSKIEAGRLDLEHQPFRLRQCVESALELVATTAADKSLDLAYLIDPRAPIAIVGDFTRLRQILLNLLNNAVKFTNQGEVVLRVGATPAEPSPDGGPKRYEIHFSVRDTGIGIPEDRMDRLFEAFTQVDASTTRRYGGTGLGLAISKRLAEEMGGRMWVESLVGRGSTFHVTIRAEAAAGPLAAEELEAIPEIAGKRVLIVDDNATNREILRRQAESWGMVPQEAATPNDALEYVRRGDPFDVAILDMQMPEMDGVALAEEIRRHRDPEALPLVMLTSLGYRDPSPSGGQFAAYMTKPIRPSQLYDALIGIFAPQMALQKVPAPSPRAATPAAERSPLRILLAEDNAVNQRVALLLLEKLGYRADVAADGREALQALERQPYDVVLMDVQMPEMDGLEATRRIVERWPGPERPRIVAMTAGATEADREACLAAGMNDYVSKPIRQDELAAALARTVPLGGGRAAGEAEGALIDPDELDQLRRTVGGQEALDEVMTTFLEDTARILAELRSDAAAGRAAEVRRHAHSLKSTAASFGATALSELCRRLEELGQAGRLEDAPALIEDVAAEFARVRTALRPGTGS